MEKKFKAIKLQVLDNNDKVLGNVQINLDVIKHLKEIHDIDALNVTANALIEEIEKISQ